MIQPSKQPSNPTGTADSSPVAIHKNAQEIEENPTLRTPYTCMVLKPVQCIPPNSGESFSPMANQALVKFISVTLPISTTL